MALITDPNITAQIRDLANTGTVDSNQLVTLLNSVLPAGQQIATNAGVTNGIYKRFGDFDKVNAKVEVVTTGLWTGDSGSLGNIYTSSAQMLGTSGYYYTNVYDYNPVAYADSAEIQFAIAYGHVNGSGSMNLADNDNALMATKATYAMASEGLDIPTLTTLIMATPKTDVCQSVGRILRTKHAHPLVIDFVDHHDIFKSQWMKRQAYYLKSGYRIMYTTNTKYAKNIWKVREKGKEPTEEVAMTTT